MMATSSFVPANDHINVQGGDWTFHSLQDRMKTIHSETPNYRAPAPFSWSTWRSQRELDPDLALTPEKKSNLRLSQSAKSFRDHAHQGIYDAEEPRTVHFSNTVDVKAFSPDASSVIDSSHNSTRDSTLETPFLDSSLVSFTADNSSSSASSNFDVLRQAQHFQPVYNASKYSPPKSKGRYHRDCSPTRASNQSPTRARKDLQVLYGDFDSEEEQHIALRPTINQPKLYNHWTDFPKPRRDGTKSPTGSGSSDLDAPIDVIAADLKPKQITKLLKQKAKKKSGSVEDLINMPTPAGIAPPQNILGKPEFHTTLKIKQEIEKLQSKEFDVASALKEKLTASTRCRAELQGKLSNQLTVRDQAFSDVVNIDVKPEEIALRADRDKPKPKVHLKKQPPLERPPDLMQFFSPKFQRETPSHRTTSVQAIKPKSSTANKLRTFDLYRHLRAWEDSV